MNKNISIVIGIVVVLIIVGGVYAAMTNMTDTMTEKKTMEATEQEMQNKEMSDSASMEKEQMMKEGDTMTGDESMQKDKEQGMDQQESMIKSAGSYEAYSADKIARAETGKVVLFFHASWCPSCRALNTDIEQNMGSIPEGVTILKTDYDKETELKKKYGVTTQHTLVQVDKDGNLIKKWSGSSKLSSLISDIK